MATSMSPIVIDGRFALESERGRGGMGTVWRARDVQTQRPIALKVLHEASRDQVDRFAREGALLASISHPAIVAYVAHGTTAEGLPYVAMEWLDGENVAERLARQPLSLLESIDLAGSALRALSAAHRHGIVHRDVKPSNLFLRNGRCGDVVLLDLGLARQASETQRLTRSGSVLGTPAYMAPEQAQGKLETTAASDVYSLGCVLFECLTGAPPFAGAQVYALLAKVLFEPAPRLTEVRPELPAALETLLSGMLQKDPALRIPDAESALALVNALAPMPDMAPPRGISAAPRPSGVEQELVSVILVGPPEGALASTADAAQTRVADERMHGDRDVSAYGGELRLLADGSAVIVVAQRRGAATDLATRAARCALALGERFRGSQLAVATGRVIRADRVCLGEAVDRAGTMLRALRDKEQCSVWLDEVTAGLLDARFRVVPRTNGLVVFELLGEDPSVDVARPLLGRPTACVGRERELVMLDLTFAACVDESEPRALLVIGPPGIGKSRLRHEFLRNCERRAHPLAVFVGAGDPLRVSGGRSLLGRAIARFAGLDPRATAPENRAALLAHSDGVAAGERDLTATFIGELCGAPLTEGVTPELRAARENPSIMGDRLARAAVAFFRARAAAAPVLLVLDDLQWSDAQTVSLVGTLLRELSGMPFMVLALGRPETLEIFPELWAPRLGTLPLGPLARAATHRLIQQVLGDVVADDAARRMVELSGGNALYLEELIRAAAARRERVPETVLAMLQARIGLLPALERRVLRIASVFGEVFPLRGVEALLHADGDAGQLAPALNALCQHEILERPADEASAGRLRFRHALMRDAAYGLMTAEDTGTSHRRAAIYLENSGEDPAVVASHAERGGDATRAIRHYARAAERAFHDNDLAAAVALVARGVACGARGEDLGVLRAIEAPALSYRHDFAAGWAASREALELLPHGHPKRVQSLAANTFAGTQLGKVSDAQLDELLGEQPRDGAIGAYVSALGYAGISHVVRANRGHAARVIERLEVLEPEFDADPFSRGHSAYWRMRYLEMLGEDTYATWRLAREALAHNERAGNRRMVSVTLASLGECARRLFSSVEAERHMRGAVAIAREIREPISWSFVQQYLATLLAQSGTEEARREADALALEAMDLAGDGQAYRALALIPRALVALARGDHEVAECHAREARATLRRIELCGYYPHADVALLQVLLARGEAATAAEVADASISLLNERAPFGVNELALRLWIARAHRACGREHDATRGVAAALAAFRRRADAIAERALRESFRTAVPEHSALIELGRELGVGS